MVLQDQKCQEVEALFEALKWPGLQAVYVPTYILQRPNGSMAGSTMECPAKASDVSASALHQNAKGKGPCCADITSTRLQRPGPQWTSS